jgi:uncharacterized membrane protein
MWKEILISSVALLGLDAIYISFTKSLWDIQIASVQRVSMQVRILGAIVCYVLLIGGLYFFILRTHRPVMEAFLMGLLIYGVYDSTNYATLKKWDWKMAVMDTLWGATLFALTTMIVYRMVKFL